MSAAELIDRLESSGRKPKQTGEGRWLASCPAHSDRSPSLSIRELDDGRVLLNDFGGCGALAVLEALGLEWGALFPPKLEGAGPSQTRVPARDLLTVIGGAAFTVELIAMQLASGQPLTPGKKRALMDAAQRIGKARTEIR